LVGDGGGEKLALLCLQLVCLFSDIQVSEDKMYEKVLESKEHQQIVEHYIKVRDNKVSVDSSE